MKQEATCTTEKQAILLDYVGGMVAQSLTTLESWQCKFETWAQFDGVSSCYLPQLLAS